MKARAQARKRADLGIAGLTAVLLLIGAQQVGQKAADKSLSWADVPAAAGRGK